MEFFRIKSSLVFSRSDLAFEIVPPEEQFTEFNVIRSTFYHYRFVTTRGQLFWLKQLQVFTRKQCFIYIDLTRVYNKSKKLFKK